MASPVGGDQGPDPARRCNGSGRARDPRLALTVTSGEHGRSRVLVVGEIDLDVAEEFRRTLLEALESGDGLELDLTRVSFCDCSALRVLMELRDRGLAAGRVVVVVEASWCVWRLLELTDTGDLLATSGTGHP